MSQAACLKEEGGQQVDRKRLLCVAACCGGDVVQVCGPTTPLRPTGPKPTTLRACDMCDAKI
jgi:hypothetical protein